MGRAKKKVTVITPGVMPGIHLSLRAYEWLMFAPTYHGVGKIYTMPPGNLVCPSPWTAHVKMVRGEVCGVEDVRALVLKQPVKLLWNPNRGDLDDQWSWVEPYVVRPIVTPTCPRCLVTLDYAFGNMCAKTGKYVEAVQRDFAPAHKFKWLGEDESRPG